jgi:glycosyltransferase involved in cell wall biosynthesis
MGVSEERIVYVPNGVERARFSPPPPADVEALRRQLELEGRRVVLYLGSMSLVSHAVDLLLESFVQVQRSVPNALLLLVGGGEDYEALQSQAEALGLGDAVRFVGRVPPESVPLYYVAAEISVDPVRDDWVARARSPLKLFESLAMGRPVVTGDIGDRRACLDDGRAGALVAPGSADALAEGFVQLLQESGVTSEMGRAAKSFGDRFAWDVLVHEVVRVYSLPRSDAR